MNTEDKHRHYIKHKLVLQEETDLEQIITNTTPKSLPSSMTVASRNLQHQPCVPLVPICSAARSFTSMALPVSLSRARSSLSAPTGCCPLTYLYSHKNTDTALTPNPPDATSPLAAKNTVMAAGTSTGLNITSSGVATTRAITVPARVRPERTMQEPPMVAAVEVLMS